MTFLSSLLTWANVPFVVALGVALTFFLLQMTGALGLIMGSGQEAEGDHEAGDGDADHDADAGHEVDGDADTDADADAGHDADADADANEADDAQPNDHAHGGQTAGGGHIGKDILAGIGVGKMPLSVVWQTFLIAFGLAGITAGSVYFDRAGGLPTHSLLWTLPLSLTFAFGVNHAFSRLFARIVVPPEKASTSRKDLIGRTGIVISSKVSAEFGEVRTVDPSGDTLRLIVRCLDQKEIILEGSEVVFVDYDAKNDLLFVASFDEGAPRPKRIRIGGTRRVSPPPAEPEDPPIERPSAGAKSAR